MSNMIDINKDKSMLLKGIAILLVLLGHLEYVYKGGTFGVNIFLILSGYGIFLSYKENRLKNYFIKKITKVYIPFLLVGTLYSLYGYFTKAIGLRSLAFSLVGLDFGYIYDKTMWYISYIFIMYIMFYIAAIITKRIKKEDISHLLIIAICIIGSYLVYRLDIKYAIFSRGAGLFLYRYSFVFGLILAYLSKFKVNINVKRVVCSVICTASLITTFLVYKKTDIETYYYLYALSIPFAAICVCEIFDIKVKALSFLGKYSYDIYLWEGIFIYTFTLISNKYINDILLITCCTLMSVIYRKFVIDNALKLIKKESK